MSVGHRNVVAVDSARDRSYGQTKIADSCCNDMASYCSTL
jgi:hypothetical protein